MKTFKLSAENIKLLEEKLQTLTKIAQANGYDDTEEDIFDCHVIDHIDALINEF